MSTPVESAQEVQPDIQALAKQMLEEIEKARRHSPARLRLVFRPGTEHVTVVKMLSKSGGMPFADFPATQAFERNPSTATVVIEDDFDPDYILDRLGPSIDRVEAVC